MLETTSTHTRLVLCPLEKNGTAFNNVVPTRAVAVNRCRRMFALPGVTSGFKLVGSSVSYQCQEETTILDEIRPDILPLLHDLIVQNLADTWRASGLQRRTRRGSQHWPRKFHELPAEVECGHETPGWRLGAEPVGPTTDGVFRRATVTLSHPLRVFLLGTALPQPYGRLFHPTRRCHGIHTRPNTRRG